MSASYNKAFILGTLSDLPHMRYSQHGEPHALLTLKCTTKDSPNDDTVHTDWVKAVCYHDAAEYAERHLNPGDLVWVEGSVELLQWTDGRSKVHKDTVVAAEKLLVVASFQGNQNQPSDADSTMKQSALNKPPKGQPKAKEYVRSAKRRGISHSKDGTKDRKDKTDQTRDRAANQKKESGKQPTRPINKSK